MDVPMNRLLEEAGRGSGRRLKLSTLMRLRWLAVSGQTAAILVVAFWFGFPLPMGACLALISLSAWLNLGLRIFFPASYRLDPNWAARPANWRSISRRAARYRKTRTENHRLASAPSFLDSPCSRQPVPRSWDARTANGHAAGCGSPDSAGCSW